MTMSTSSITASIGNLADGLTAASQTAWEAHFASSLDAPGDAVDTLMPVLAQLQTFTALCKDIIATHGLGEVDAGMTAYR